MVGDAEMLSSLKWKQPQHLLKQFVPFLSRKIAIIMRSLGTSAPIAAVQ